MSPIFNEVETNNPGLETPSCEFIELRGDPGSAVGANIYVVEVEGDAGFQGIFDFVRNVSADTFGTKGILTISGTGAVLGGIGGPCGSRNYTANGGNLITDGGVTLENGTISFLLIRSPTTPITQGIDYDTNDDGTLEGLPGDAVILDAIAFTDGDDVNDRFYGGVLLFQPNTVGPPDAATRNINNITPLTSAAWFADDLTPGAAIDAVTYDQLNFTGKSDMSFGGFIIDFISPGRQNVAPSAASGTVAGRVRNVKGNGLKFITVMITSNGLPEPLYATTNNFGHYRFEDIPLGNNYVLQVFSRRYIFQQQSMIINLTDNIENADFIGGESE